MEQELQRIKEVALTAIKAATNQQALQDVRVKYLGKKGEVTALLKGLGKLSPEERPKMGAFVNAVRETLEAELDKIKSSMETAAMNARLEEEKIDITLPGRAPKTGHIHPLTTVNEMIEDFFMKMGYTVEEGPEVEQDYYNFECLNLPKDHPARDMQDSFYITENFLLRTHTSPVQARTMQRHEPNSPIRMIAPGKVYRWDYDATHSPVFHQVEGLIIDEHITFADLKGTIERCGYICMAENDSRIDFNKGYTLQGFAERVFHLHLCYEGDNDELYFRDYLQANTAIAKEYERLKLDLWKQYEHDRNMYTSHKGDFVEQYTQKGKLLFTGRYDNK